MHQARSPGRRGPVRAVAKACGLLVFTGALYGCGLSDVRPESIRNEGIRPEATREAQRLVRQVEEAYGGRELWESFEVAHVVARDQWPSAMFRTLFMPWPESDLRVRYDFLLGTFDSRLEFLEGELQGDVWGIQHWMTYTRPGGGEAEFAHDDDITFYLPTYQYFFEMPFRMAEIPLIAHAGEASLDGEVHDLVFATWETAEPHVQHDQYVFWIHRDSHRISQVTYTVRDMGTFVSGNNRFDDFRRVEGVLVPFRQTITDEPGSDNVLHRLVVESVELDREADTETFFPASEKRGSKPVPQ